MRQVEKKKIEEIRTDSGLAIDEIIGDYKRGDHELLLGHTLKALQSIKAELAKLLEVKSGE